MNSLDFTRIDFHKPTVLAFPLKFAKFLADAWGANQEDSSRDVLGREFFDGFVGLLQVVFDKHISGDEMEWTEGNRKRKPRVKLERYNNQYEVSPSVNLHFTLTS